MTAEHLTELARQWVAEQGQEAGEHLADAIRKLREVGDEKGARLLMWIAQRVDLVEGAPPRRAHMHRAMIRRPRDDRFDPSA